MILNTGDGGGGAGGGQGGSAAKLERECQCSGGDKQMAAMGILGSATMMAPAVLADAGPSAMAATLSGSTWASMVSGMKSRKKEMSLLQVGLLCQAPGYLGRRAAS